MNRVIAALWALAAVLAALAGIQAPPLPDHPWLVAALPVMVGVMLAGLFVPPARAVIAWPVRGLRRRPSLLWLALLVVIFGGLGAWVVTDQPTNGRALLPHEYAWLLLLLWLTLYLLCYDLDADQARAMGAQLGRSRLAGVLVTLTTLLLLFSVVEAYLRVFYITTDGYGFTAMNYHWYKNFYWGHYNSLGYRDYEPKPDAPGLTRVAVVGDSFAMGHGINNLDDTFAQILERDLGENYDVNLVAQSGWDTDVHLAYLENFPLRPDIVILSYYLNDIDYLLQDPAVNPDSHFTFPQNPALYWVVLNFFAPNYLYYNLLQFTSPTRTANHLLDLVNAHLNDAYWGPQAERLGQIVDWTAARGMRLIVLLWPYVTQPDVSQPATARVKAFFEGRGVTVVDMTDVLRGQDSPQLVVNRFDAHPGVLAHRLAAEALLPVITGG